MASVIHNTTISGEINLGLLMTSLNNAFFDWAYWIRRHRYRQSDGSIPDVWASSSVIGRDDLYTKQAQSLPCVRAIKNINAIRQSCLEFVSLNFAHWTPLVAAQCF